MKKKLMVIGASRLQLPAIQQAQKLGHEVICVDMNPRAIGFMYADVKCVISTIDIDRVVAEAIRLRPDGVMTLASDMPMRTVAAVADALGLNSIDTKTALQVTDKADMRLALSDHGVPIPRFHIVANYAEYEEAVKGFSGEFITKPADNSGSRGVYLVRHAREIKNAFEHSHRLSRSGRVLVEECMYGPEVSVETFTIQGNTYVVAVTDKQTTGAPHFVETGHTVPSSLDGGAVAEIEKVAVMACEALGISSGPSHTEIILTSAGPKIVEVGARLGGDHITTCLVPLATGINMVDMAIKYALGEPVTVQGATDSAACIRFILPERAGVFAGVKGLEEAGSIAGVQEVCFDRQLGDRVDLVTSSLDRLGFVIAKAQSVAEATAICETALRRIEVYIT